MNTQHALRTAIRIALLGVSLGLAAPALSAPVQVAANSPAATLYQQGQRALDAGDYAKAIAAFSEVSKSGASDADAGLYWKAYAELRAGRAMDARRSLEQFQKQHPQSRWSKDAQALKLDVDSALGKAPRPERAEDEDLKLYALDGLMQMAPAKALPILRKFLAGDHSPRLKERALFVASQSDLPEAHRLVLDATRDSKDPDTQRRAIQMLGMTDDKDLLKELVAIYRDSSDVRVKRAVLDAWMTADDKASVLAVARSEKEPTLRRQAVNLLGAMDAVPELEEMLRAEKDAGVRRGILEAFMVADHEAGLLAVAKGDADPALRRHAVHMLGAADAGEALRGLLRTETDTAVRRAIMEGFMAAGDSEGLLEAARSEKDPAVRRTAIQMLGALDHDDLASSEFERLYRESNDAAQKRTVAEALMVRGDAKTLIKLFRAEQDPALKRHMMQMLSHMDGPEAEQAVLDILDK